MPDMTGRPRGLVRNPMIAIYDNNKDCPNASSNSQTITNNSNDIMPHPWGECFLKIHLLLSHYIFIYYCYIYCWVLGSSRQHNKNNIANHKIWLLWQLVTTWTIIWFKWSNIVITIFWVCFVTFFLSSIFFDIIKRIWKYCWRFKLFSPI